MRVDFSMSSSLQHDVVATSASIAPLGVASLRKLRIAIVHYWFVNRRGGERVVEAMAKMFPEADLFSLVVDPEKLHSSLRERSIKTSFLQKVPGGRRWHRHMLPLYPLALEQFDLNGYDLVLSSESGPAKGVLTNSRTCHVCYCHSPMRYLWDFYQNYKNGRSLGVLSRPVFLLASHYLRMWDAASAQRVDHFVANSGTVAARIQKHYRRDAVVIHPPVDVRAGYLASRIEDYYLFAGQLADYKRADVAIEACNRLGRRLRIVGEGEQYKTLRRLVGPSITFCGPLSDQELHEQYAHCRALIFPGEEDFGIVPVEAMSFGRPVIAYGRGGATETVRGFSPRDSSVAATSSGLFFHEQTAGSLMEAMLCFEKMQSQFSPFWIKQSVERFDESHFAASLGDYLAEKVREFQANEKPA
jgi:glycosyltransferase involved in cell wall biosynthesis